MRDRRSLRRPVRAALAAALLMVAAPVVQAGDVTLFVARTEPSELWANGWGAALATSWFSVVQLEGEAARIPGDSDDASMTTFTGSAFLAAPIGPVTPYGGIGIGFFRQALSDRSDTGFLRSFAIGAKLKLGLLVLRGEWRKQTLSGEPLFPVESRLSAGVGIAF
jgi:hypothetical protein